MPVLHRLTSEGKGGSGVGMLEKTVQNLAYIVLLVLMLGIGTGWIAGV
jgi:hypothetical protein